MSWSSCVSSLGHRRVCGLHYIQIIKCDMGMLVLGFATLIAPT